MSRGQDEFDERLRRALHDAADRVQPADDGLDKIRRSLRRPRPVLLAGMMAACGTAARRAWGGLHTFMAWLPTVFAATPQSQRGAPPGMPRRRRAGTALVALLAAAVAVAGVFALTAVLRQSAPGTAAGSHSLPGGGPAGPNAPLVNGHGGQLAPGSAAGAAPAHRPPGWPAAGPAPCPAPTPAPGPSATPAVSPPARPRALARPRAPARPPARAHPQARARPPARPRPPARARPPAPARAQRSRARRVPPLRPNVTPPPPAGSPADQAIFVKKTLTNLWPPRVAAQIRPGKRSRHGHDGGLKPSQGRRHHRARQRHLAEGANRPRGLGRANSRLAGGCITPRMHSGDPDFLILESNLKDRTQTRSASCSAMTC
jgi:hypothetical protein